MKGSRFVTFLIIALSGTAVLAGYIMIGRGLNDNTDINTGTLLDKFNGQTSNSSLSEEIPKDGSPILVSKRQVISPTNSSNSGSIIYYDKNTGDLYESNIESRAEKLVSNKPLSNLIGTVWSPLKRFAINLFQSNNTLNLKYFDIITGKEVSLNAGIRSVAFSPDGNLLASYYFEETGADEESILSPAGIGRIVLSQPDGTQGKKILDTRLKDIDLSWPIKDKLAIKNNSSEIFLLTEDGLLTKLLEHKVGLEEKWSPSGKKVLFSSLSADDRGLIRSNLSIKDIDSGRETDLNIEGSASLCNWSKDDVNFICALPDSSSTDRIYRINSSDGSKKKVAEPEMLIRELFLSTLEEYVIFVNAGDEKIYSIKISD